MNKIETAELLLIRHAESIGNTKGYFSSELKDPLSPEGEKQAHALRDILKAKNTVVDIVITSTALRAIHTANILFPNQPKEQDAKLLEINTGAFMQNNGQLNIKNYLTQRFPNGESYADLYQRIAVWLKSVTLKPGMSLAVVAHGGAIGMIIHQLLNEKLESFPHFRIDNASVTRALINPQTNECLFSYVNFCPHFQQVNR